MIYLFSDAGQAALRHFIDASTLFAFDLDGTLAPIVPEPEGILIPKGIWEGLIRLNRMAPVAIITGRGRADARRHLGFKPRFLVGNHGAEGLPGYKDQEILGYVYPPGTDGSCCRIPLWRFCKRLERQE
jgi:trehalose 6-phosphate phosphatase